MNLMVILLNVVLIAEILNMIFGYDNDASIGGFAGFNHDDLENCYNTGNINIINNEGVAWVCGGIIGEWSGDENINNCYALGNISINMKDGSLIAGLAGNEEGEYKTILNISLLFFNTSSNLSTS